jgi:hypothetical protein
MLERPRSRRVFLGSALGATAGLAGCLALDSEGESGGQDEPESGSESEPERAPGSDTWQYDLHVGRHSIVPPTETSVEILVKDIPETTESAAQDVLADDETIARAARLGAVRVEVRRDTDAGVLNVRYLPD